MRKCNNARFNKHDCANDGTCGQSIQSYKVGNSNISFHDSDGRAIAQIPKLPNGNSITYYNNLYETAESKILLVGQQNI
ncbi:MAG: hypothetical protein LBJ80_03905 [Rickettsiales bacterium]|jgi:hypothetical protein|nr:hypothetical protein [Rickettsiales bacterium]MDR1261533.1 hypothetical protein [Rickettsiales bacterium]